MKAHLGAGDGRFAREVGGPEQTMFVSESAGEPDAPDLHARRAAQAVRFAPTVDRFGDRLDPQDLKIARWKRDLAETEIDDAH